jgi:hypothetical protein
VFDDTTPPNHAVKLADGKIFADRCVAVTNGFHCSTAWGFGPADKPSLPPDARRRECVLSRRLRIRVN